MSKGFIPAEPSNALIALMQSMVRVDLSLNNRVRIDAADVANLSSIPRGAGVTLTPNHADEADPRVCLDLSRRSGRRFISMCNREAFDEFGGIGGWALQRLGMFSVERGAHDTPAKNFAIDVLRAGKDVLVVFPEGEIFYLNELVQPFHSGAVEIGMQAMIANRKTDPQWTSFMVPMAIKYTYPQPIDAILSKRIGRMERTVGLPPTDEPLHKRLRAIMATVLQKEQDLFHINAVAETDSKLGDHVHEVRRAILEQLAQKYNDNSSAQRRTIDASWELSARLRDLIAQGTEHPTEVRHDLSSLHRVAHMVSWQPKYIATNPSRDRMAEVVMKLERELYHEKRPQPLGVRNVHLRIAKPIDLGEHFEAYLADPKAVRNSVTELLHEQIQALIDTMIPVPLSY